MSSSKGTELSCPHCGGALTSATVTVVTGDAIPGEVRSLLPQDHVVGRAIECEIALPEPGTKISRRHACLLHRDGRFLVKDLESRNGTAVNGRPLGPGEQCLLHDGDRITLGDTIHLDYHDLRRKSSQGAGAAFYERFLTLVREMSALDLPRVVDRGLELLRLASGVERSYLVGAGVDPQLEPHLLPLADPSVQVSRSTIETALRTGRKATRFLGDEVAGKPSESVAALGLRRIWVCPILDAAGCSVAAVYLDSQSAGEPFDAETERLMDAVVGQLAMALRNASLHAEVVSLNEGLESMVRRRTQQLEESRARLMGQDRLATMGRLVAAIAHELNNPAGALVSLAWTLEGLLLPVLRSWDEAEAAFPDPAETNRAWAILLLSLERAAVSPPLDTRKRRALTEEIERFLTERDVSNVDALAPRLARIGLAPPDLEPYLDLLRSRGMQLAALADRIATFGRGLKTVGECAGNVARIVDGLKTYSHLDRSETEEADIHRGIEATLTVLASRIPAGVTVETRFAEIPPFAHRPGEMTQVWTNLVDNALRAMGERGTLTIETRDEGDHVRVAVTDTGGGVPDELEERIFDLDVTTRGPGAGLGLGLPICRTIVEQNHSGRISFESRPGHTVFTVVLPKSGPRVGKAGA